MAEVSDVADVYLLHDRSCDDPAYLNILPLLQMMYQIPSLSICNWMSSGVLQGFMQIVNENASIIRWHVWLGFLGGLWNGEINGEVIYSLWLFYDLRMYLIC